MGLHCCGWRGDGDRRQRDWWQPDWWQVDRRCGWDVEHTAAAITSQQGRMPTTGWLQLCMCHLQAKQALCVDMDHWLATGWLTLCWVHVCTACICNATSYVQHSTASAETFHKDDSWRCAAARCADGLMSWPHLSLQIVRSTAKAQFICPAWYVLRPGMHHKGQGTAAHLTGAVGGGFGGGLSGGGLSGGGLSGGGLSGGGLSGGRVSGGGLMAPSGGVPKTTMGGTDIGDGGLAGGGLSGAGGGLSGGGLHGASCEGASVLLCTFPNGT